MPVEVDYKEFLAKRFDIVIRFHFLAQSKGVDTARLIYESKKYKFLNPILERSKLFESKDKHTWEYVGRKVKNDPHWLRHCPYMVDKTGLGFSVKRFLMSIKYWRPLYWMSVDCPMDKDKKNFYKWKKETYETRLTEKQFKMFEMSEMTLLIFMSHMKYFSSETKMGYMKHGTIILY